MGGELLERDADVAEIGRLVDEAVAGSGRVLLLEGPAGCGKTRLLEEACARAAQAGARTLAARGGELERGFPFGLARQLFEAPLAAATAGERRRLLAGAAALAGPALGLEPTAAPDGDGLFQALHGLYWLTTNLADSEPLVLVVDDLHWADAPTLRWLGYLARRIDGLPVLLAVAVRSGEPHDDPLLLDAVTAHADTLRPASLTVEAVATLVGDAALGEACHHATAGNPFMVRELLIPLDGSLDPERVAGLGPESVARSVRSRLERLAPGADRLARAVAVLGLGAEPRHAAALAQLDERTAATAADALAAATILTPGRPLDFVHPIVRTAIYDDLPAQERGLAHREAARLLAREGADPQRVAAHLRSSLPAGDPEAVELLRRAARAALAQGAAAEAIADLRRALEEPPPTGLRGALLLELGVAEREAHDPAGVEHLELAVQAIADPPLLCTALRELARALLVAGRVGDALEAVDRAVRALDGRDDDVRREIDAELIAAGQMGMLPGHSIGGRVARLDAAAIDAGTPGGRMLLAVLAFEAVRAADPAQEAAALAQRALQSGGVLEPIADSMPRYLALLSLLYCERFAHVHERGEAELTVVRERGSASGFATISLLIADAHYRCGALADAESHAQAVLGMDGIEAHGPVYRGYAVGTLLGCMLERGEHEAAAAMLAAGGMDALPPELMLHSLLLARGQVRIAAGNARGGLEDLNACGRLLTAAGCDNSAPVPWRPAAALAHAALGERAEAQRLADRELELARRFGAARALGVALRAAGLVHGRLALLEEAVTVLGGSEARLEYARALTDFGAAHRRAGARAAARDPLRRGLDLAHACGATALATRAHAELVAAGARPRRMALSGKSSLTPSERRVAQLARQGLGNREIAQALFVTVKTVETHLGHVYAKLGIGSRDELPEGLGETSTAH